MDAQAGSANSAHLVFGCTLYEPNSFWKNAHRCNKTMCRQTSATKGALDREKQPEAVQRCSRGWSFRQEFEIQQKSLPEEEHLPEG